MNTELMEALAILEKEKNISREVILDAIESSLVSASQSYFGATANVKVTLDRETCDYLAYAEKEVVDEVLYPATEISLEDAKKIDPMLECGDVAQVPVPAKGFGRIATQNAKSKILQKIREEEKNAVYREYADKEKQLVTGIVQRYVGKNISINLGRTDALLTEKEQVKSEHFRPTDHIRLYVVSVIQLEKSGKTKITISRTHPELVRRLFEEEVTEVREGIVEIKSIAREPGSRTKMAVWSNDPEVDPVGACVGMNGSRVNAVVQELCGEKIDIICWDENPALLIENALSPAKVIAVMADPEDRIANVIVPDYQLSLAIGREGQNARLAARLTGFKIDIKSESQAIASGDLPENYMEEMGLYGEEGYTGDYADDEYGDEYSEEYADEYAGEGYADDFYGDEAYADEYAGESYADEAYAEGAGADGRYADEAYTDGEGTDAGYADEEYADGAGADEG